MFRHLITLAVLSLAAAGAHAAGTVNVAFVSPERFADFHDRSHTVDQNAKALEKVIVAAAAPYVADGQTLSIEVLDVDLAGEPKPGSHAWDVRVLRGGADWPRIALRWRLEGTGAAARSGDAVVQDMSYLQRLRPPYSSAGLAYERRMLDDWFRRQFGKAAG